MERIGHVSLPFRVRQDQTLSYLLTTSRLYTPQDIVNQKRGEILSHSVGDEKVTKEDVGGKDLLSVIRQSSLSSASSSELIY